MEASIDQAERKWQAHGITSYRIEVLTVQSVWHAQSHQITVRDGKVIDQSASCIPAPTEMGVCEVQPYKAEDYTVPGLFAKAHWMVENIQARWMQINFDSQYDFPSQISFDDPDAIDDDWAWRVMAFDPLK